jgi:hypothetical protein
MYWYYSYMKGATEIIYPLALFSSNLDLLN